MDIVTLGAALNGSAEYVNSHFKGGSNIQIVDNPDGTQTINASGEVSSEDTVARADIEAIKDGETIDSFGDVETALATKANTSTTYTKTEVDTALSAKANSADVYSKSDIDTAMSAKADKSTTYTKTEVDTALDDKVDKVSGKGLSTNDYTTAEKTKLAGIAEGAEVNEIESIKVNNTTINPDANKVVNITVPTTAADVSALPDTTKYAVALSLTINSSTFVMTGQLKDQNGDNLGTAQTIDLPLESVVVGGSYNSQTKKVVLTLQNGNTIEFSVADLVSGLQTELSTSNKLNPAFIEYDSTHRAVSDTEKSAWNSKQNALSSTQLDAVNSGIDSTKVEQIETNKNNILSIYNTGFAQKNVMYIVLDEVKAIQSWATFINNTITFGNLAVTFNNDNSITLNGSHTVDVAINFKDLSHINIPTNAVGAANANITLSDDIFFGLWGDSGVPNLVLNDGVDIPSDYASKYSRGFIIRVSANTVCNNVRIYPMVCDKALYQASSEVVPYALSNVELTAKEQQNEDNISTLEEMNGAKNKFNYEAWKNCGVLNGTKTIDGNSFTIVASGDDCFTWYENSTPRPYPINARIPCNAGDKVVLTWDYTPLSGQTNDRVGIFANGLPTTGFFALALSSAKKLEFTAPNGTTYLSIRFGVQVSGNSATYGNIQIQSKASYDAGFTDYQPYAMSNAELTDKERVNENNISSIRTDLAKAVTKGDRYAVNEARIYTLNPANTYLITIISYNVCGVFIAYKYPAESFPRLFSIYKSADFDNLLSVSAVASSSDISITPTSNSTWFISNIATL